MGIRYGAHAGIIYEAGVGAGTGYYELGAVQGRVFLQGIVVNKPRVGLNRRKFEAGKTCGVCA